MIQQIHFNKKRRGLTTSLILVISTLFFSFGTVSQTIVNSLPELLPYLDQDNVDVKVTPGTYTITAADIEDGTFGTPRFAFSGNNSTYDFTGVTINFAADVYTSGHTMFHIQTLGNSNVLKNLTMVDQCDAQGTKVTGGTNIVMDGTKNRIEGFHMTVKGSYPYGYGDVFGKGSTYTLKHYKHCAFLMRGYKNHALNDTIIHRAYGHAMYMQAAQYPTIEGCYIEGEVRTTDDMLAETSGPAFDIDFLTIYGYRLLPGYIKSTGEEGIRAYDAGSTIINGVTIGPRGTSYPTILNNTIVNMRGGVTLTHATGTKYVEGCVSIGCERGYAIGAGDIVDCYADAKHGAVFGVDYESDQNINVEITVLPYEGKGYNGNNRLAWIQGTGHNITFHNLDPSPDQSYIIQMGGDKVGLTSEETIETQIATGITINNFTNSPIFLSPESSDCTGLSGGMVTDLGTNNTINHTPVSVYDIEAEDYSDMSGVTIDTTSDDGGGDMLTSIDVDDWVEFEVDVPYTGTYSMAYRLANEVGDDSLTLSVNGLVLDQLAIPVTGDGQSWATVNSSSPFALTEGLQTIRLTSDASDWNINWISLLFECAYVPVVSYIEVVNSFDEILSSEQTSELSILPGNTAILNPEPVGGTWSWTGPDGFSADTRVITFTNIQKSNAGKYSVIYTNDCGIQSVDTITINVVDSFYIEAENYTAMDGVDVEATADLSGTSNVTSISSGDWIEFEIDVPFAATYSFDYRVASETTSSEFTVEMDSAIIDNIIFESTGGTQTWTTISSNYTVDLEAGVHTLRLISNTDSWNINWLKLEAVPTMRPCDYPLLFEGFNVENTTVEWTSGLLDISCLSKVDLSLVTEGFGSLETSDYLNIFYKIDGGEKVSIAEETGMLDSTTLSVLGLLGNSVEIIVESHSSSLDSYYSISQITMLGLSDTTIRIEAEDYDAANGTITQTTSDDGGGSNVGTIKDGNWLMFENMSVSQYNNIDVRLATIHPESTMEVRLDSETGTLIGTLDITVTDAWQSWVTLSAPLDSISGVFDLYLVFKNPNGTSVCNINWFELSSVTSAPPSSSVSDSELLLSQIYPNPVSDILTITNSEGATLEIYNIMGEMLNTQILDTDKQSVQMDTYKAGIYILRMLNDGETKSFRVIKQ